MGSDTYVVATGGPGNPEATGVDERVSISLRSETTETPAYVELRLEDMVDRVVTGLAWLTPAEAREVAAGLLASATACDGQRPCCQPLDSLDVEAGGAR